MNRQKGFTPLEVEIPERENRKLPERHGEGPRLAGSQTDVRKRHRSFLRKSRKGRLAAESLGLTGFTLIELLVVIAIIALLMAILMPSLQRVRKQAKAVICQSNLKEWALIWAMYTEENNGEFPEYMGFSWMDSVLEKYAKTGAMSYCPLTKRTVSEGAPVQYAIIESGGNRYGSYTLNEWVFGYDIDSLRRKEDYWRHPNHKGLNNIPVMGDGYHRCDGQPFPTDNPPEYEGQTRSNTGVDEIRLFCIDRHEGSINVMFMDWTTRKVGLKELWVLKWHRNYDIAGPWTRGGFVQPGDWPGWMRHFKDY